MKSISNFIIRVIKEVYLIFNIIVQKPNFVKENLDYDNYWIQRESEGEINKLRGRFIAFSNVIEIGSSVLDVGCGDGSLLKFLVEKRNCKPYGIDISKMAIKLTKAKGVPCKLLDLSKPDSNISKSFDYIILSEVLEHIAFPEFLINKIINKFRKHILISIPNSGYIAYRLRYLFGRFPIQWRHHPSEHIRFWTIKDFKDWLAALDLEIDRIIAIVGFPFLGRFFYHLFGSQIVFVVKRKIS